MFRGTKRYNKNPQRRKVPGVGAENKLASRTPIRISEFDAGVGSPQVDVVFDGPCFYTGILPGWTATGGLTVISAVQQAPDTIRFTWSANIVATNIVTIPFEDPSIRNSAGGYVRDITFEAT